MTQFKPGSRIRSAVCDTEVMVIAAPDSDAQLTCGGAPMHALDADPPAGAALDADAAEGTQLGKRYVNEAGDIELLCTKPGKGTLAAGGTALTVKGAKPLPASD
ncbi:MAG: hypothetical protein VX546_13205 [Myxococcota bacterium]|nr:hypothetical protein [Myxococcota bacterium]